MSRDTTTNQKKIKKLQGLYYSLLVWGSVELLDTVDRIVELELNTPSYETN